MSITDGDEIEFLGWRTSGGWAVRAGGTTLRQMTILWTSLVVIGVAMIAVAVWPSIRSRGKAEEGEKPEGV
jgi:hypothetical protein